jgi:hypothetical protein
MTEIRASLTPASFSATNPSVEVSNLVFDCLIFAAMMSSAIFAFTSRITSRLVMAAGPVLLAPVLGAVFCPGDCWAVLLGGELCGEAPTCARDLPPNVASNATNKAFHRRRFTVFPFQYLHRIFLLGFPLA